MLPINVNLPLKSVTDRAQSCRAVKWAIDTHGTRLAGDLGDTFHPLLADGQVMPFETQLELFKKKLCLDLDRVVATDRQYRDQKARESISRRHRDDQVDSVTSEVLGLRKALTGILSDDKLAELGFARRTPTRPEVLQEQASHLVERLGDSESDMSGSRYRNLQLDVSDLAQELNVAVEALQTASDDLVREERETEVLKLAKDEALTTYNQSFLWIARTVEALCRLAGLDEVAKRVRPSQRRPGVTAQRFVQPSDSSEGGDDGKSEGEASTETSSEAAAGTSQTS